MSDTPIGLSRRGLLVGTAAASAVTFAGTTPALASRAGPAGASTLPFVAPLVTRDRIATAATRLPGGGLAALRFQVDLHEQLTAWLAFWSANSPRSWGEPVQVTGRTDPAGGAYTLTGLHYQRDDQARDGFAVGRVDRTYWATVASLHHHFPAVRADADGIHLTAGPAGFTGAPDQLAFAASACRQLWGYRAATGADWQSPANQALRRAGQLADITSRAGWATFTRTSLRLGLDTEAY
jgi:hypothetical protein